MAPSVPSLGLLAALLAFPAAVLAQPDVAGAMPKACKKLAPEGPFIAHSGGGLSFHGAF